MKTADEILKEYSISYDGIRYSDFDHALKAMKIYANQVGIEIKKSAEERLKSQGFMLGTEAAEIVKHTPFKLP